MGGSHLQAGDDTAWGGHQGEVTACYVSPMRAAPLLCGLFLVFGLVAGCDNAPIPTIGISLDDAFPQNTDWYWRYANDGTELSDVAYWVGMPVASSNDETALSFRWWLGDGQDIIEDFAGDSVDYDLTANFAARPDGIYLMGWEASSDGDYAALGAESIEGDGIPLAMTNVTNGKQWTAEANGRQWTTTATHVTDPLEFHGQLIEDCWRLDLSSDVGDTPFEGSYWTVAGPGIVQWDLQGFRPEMGEPWQHVTNDLLANALGDL